MSFEFEITVPADTAKTSPEEVEAILPAGIITLVEVSFAAGCHRMVNIAIKEGAHQMFPRNPERAICADDYTVRFNPHQKLKRGHNILKMLGWSPDTTYQHKIAVRFNVQPIEIATPWEVLRDFVSILKKLIGVD